MKYIGYTSAILLLLCGLPELYYGFTENKVNVSYAFLTLWFLGEVLGLIYVIPKKHAPLILNYLGCSLIVGALIAIKYYN